MQQGHDGGVVVRKKPPSSKLKNAAGASPTDLASTRANAIRSMKICYKSVGVSAVVDSIALFSVQHLRGANEGIDMFAYLAIFWKVGWMISVYMVAKVAPVKKVKLEDINKVITSVCRKIAPMFRLAAWLISLGALNDIVGLFQEKLPWTRTAFLAVLIASAVAIRSISERDAQQTLVVVGKDNQNVRDAASFGAQRCGFITARNMGLCAGALVIQGIVLIPVALASEPSWIGRALMLSGVPTPIKTSRLLWTLRRAILDVTVTATTADKDYDPQLEVDLSNAQTDFYSDVASSFQQEAGLKVVLGTGRWIASHYFNK
jgi:hypothetical protein